MHIPENRCRCENLQSEAKWSLAGSLYGNGLEFHSQPKPLSRALLGVEDTEQTRWHIHSPKGRHFRHRMKYE